MGIRSTSYYGWETLLTYGPGVIGSGSIPAASGAIKSTVLQEMAADSSGSLYAVGGDINLDFVSSYIVLKSTDGGKLWETVYRNSGSSNRNSDGPEGQWNNIANSIAIDNNDNIYVAGRRTFSDSGFMWQVDKSTDSGKTWVTVASTGNISVGVDSAHIVRTDSSGKVYVGGNVYSNSGWRWHIIGSDTGDSGSFVVVDKYVQPNNFNSFAHDIAIDPNNNNNIYVAGIDRNTNDIGVRRSTDGGSVWENIMRDRGSTLSNVSQDAGIVVDGNGGVYVSYVSSSGGTPYNVITFSPTGNSGTINGSWTKIATASSDISTLDEDIYSYRTNRIAIVSTLLDNYLYTTAYDKDIKWAVYRMVSGTSMSQNNFAKVDTFTPGGIRSGAKGILVKDDFIYVCGVQEGSAGVAGNFSYIRRGKLAANSSSIGPAMLAASVGYTNTPAADNSGSDQEQFKLNNISEFPHSSGLFQMKNMILGTTDKGTIGRKKDDIVQVTHFGSVVHIMWPKQEETEAVAGFGDFSVGERAGKLLTQFQPGNSVDATEFDHMALYCGLVKHASGTLDDIIISVERKPLKSSGFSTEQSVEFSISGSKTEARLRDIEYKKEINYGDLSIKEISFPIDIPLTNVKEVRVKARHANGQAEENKNFIIWGRFIRADKNTNET